MVKTGHISSTRQNSQSLRETDKSHLLRLVPLWGREDTQETNVYNFGMLRNKSPSHQPKIRPEAC